MGAALNQQNYTVGPRDSPQHCPCAAANERTFLSWLSMATTLGTVGTAIAGFAVADADASGNQRGGVSHGTVELITLLLLPISIAMCAYALFTFYWRSEFIRRKQVRRVSRTPARCVCVGMAARVVAAACA